VGLAPSYAYLVLEKESEPKGGGGMLFLNYHITGTIALRAAALWTGHSIDATSSTSASELQVLSGVVGAVYAVDWLGRLSPAIEGGIGVLYRWTRKASAFDFGLQLGIAVDYWVTRWLAIGAAIHYHAFLTNPTQYPVYFDAGPRVIVRWGGRR
jgi:hypothetical protein